jgi:hypothetical protein
MVGKLMNILLPACLLFGTEIELLGFEGSFCFGDLGLALADKLVALGDAFVAIPDLAITFLDQILATLNHFGSAIPFFALGQGMVTRRYWRGAASGERAERGK